MGLVSIILPAYCEEKVIGRTIASIHDVMQKVSDAYEILVVDDGSCDLTAMVAEQAGAIVLRNPTNLGYIASIKRAFQVAKGDYFVTIDADGELPAEKIPDLIRLMETTGAGMVQGHRAEIPRSSEKILTWLAQKKAPVGDSGTGLRAIRKDLARSLEIKGKCICGVLSLEVIHRGARIREIPIHLIAVAKPRNIAWYHLRQFFYLLPWLFRHYPKEGLQRNEANLR